MINGYAIFGNIEVAKKLFDEMPERNVISWNSMLAGYVKCGDVEEAQVIFHRMPWRDIVSWNSMLACYVQCGKSNEALAFFNEMRDAGVKPTESTVVSLSSACAHIGALDQASRLHFYINEHKIAVTTIVGTALVNMYARCGSISLATQVFNSLEHKDVLTWNTIITAMAIHGHAEEALQLFKEMQQAGVCPDDITFVATLSACSHAGMVEEGQRLLGCMRSIYGIHPKVEHYGCLIDLLSRAGHLVAAIELIESMPMEPNSNAWGALLGGCRIHGNVEIGVLMHNNICKRRSYVLLSNIYAAAKRWDDAGGVRKRMKIKGVTKVPGISMIELNGNMHQFLSGDQSHPESDNIYRKWSDISARLKCELAYSPDTVQVLFDIEEEEKEQALSIHSEKLAIAFGFLHMGPEDIIRIVKNLRLLCYFHEYDEHEFCVRQLCISENSKLEWKIEDSEEFKSLEEDICNGYSDFMDKRLTLFPLPKSIPFKIIAYNPRSKTLFLFIPNLILFLCIPNAVFSFDIAQRSMELIWGAITPKFELSSYASPYVHSFAAIEVCPLVDSSAINMFEEKDAALKHDQKKTSATKKKVKTSIKRSVIKEHNTEAEAATSDDPVSGLVNVYMDEGLMEVVDSAPYNDSQAIELKKISNRFASLLSAEEGESEDI
ncbi:Pentatricopeptide repeat-containing protein [Thalictrum thalictroides]|uniref:Pentatricopeptide repeat-containing protein n=1 Tax=Thalictrum thalictroides TaxID=46969 RepID=A0A7J6XA38_THATH|nr:Pentatricopeptide repeat-containing protein [Thalictrum thalictroides]